MRLLPCLLLSLAACAPEADIGPPPAQTRPNIIIDPADSGLDEQVARAVAFYRQLGYDIDMGSGGQPVVWTVDDRLGVSDGVTIRLSTSYDLWFGDGDCHGYSVEMILRHELGHAMGFHHVDDPEDIMYPHMGYCEIKSRLAAKEP